ncbi:MAG: YceI family protein [Halobacteriovoraceae bacterium]|nr:YceI family protein [Halobacteriovoraceae bacterium]
MRMKNNIKIFILSLLFSPLSSANCPLGQDGNKPIIGFTAFKTPSKVGVKGVFKKVTWKGESKEKSLRKLLSGLNFEIDATSVDTKDEGRNENIIESFFSVLNEKNKIVGKISKVSKKQILLELKLNGKKNMIPLNYSFENSVFNGSGHIDLMDFSASKALQSINKACYALHEGKTWSHVEINVTHKLPGCKF